MKDYRLITMWQNKKGESHRVQYGSKPQRRHNGLRRRSAGHRRGSVVLTVAFGMVVLCGFCAIAVDYGRAVLVKNQLQRACDAGALAGVKYLPNYDGLATMAAIYYAYQNKAMVNANGGVQITHNRSHIRVRATQNVNYLFAPVMNILNGDVSAQSTAAVQQRDNFLPPYVVPIGITPSTYETYKDGRPVVLEGIRQNKQDLDIGEFVLFDLRDSQNAKSPSHMQDQLQWGTTFNEVTFIGGQETTLNAATISEAKKFEDGMQTRFAAAAGVLWSDNGTLFTDIPEGSPRMMIFIVTPEQQPINGNNKARVVGFAPVYVETMTVSGDTMRIRARMLPLTAIGGGTYTDVKGYDPDATPFYLTRLIA
jgi:Flp pilus assembly protein TadG